MRPARLLLAAFALCCSCAQTKIYHDGELAAVFQGDMKGVHFETLPDGGTVFIADGVNHSEATRAQGDSAAAKLTAGAAAIGAAVPILKP